MTALVGHWAGQPHAGHWTGHPLQDSGHDIYAGFGQDIICWTNTGHPCTGILTGHPMLEITSLHRQYMISFPEQDITVGQNVPC